MSPTIQGATEAESRADTITSRCGTFKLQTTPPRNVDGERPSAQKIISATGQFFLDLFCTKLCIIIRNNFSTELSL